MTYQEWIAKDLEHMLSDGPEGIVEILKANPFGMIEPDENKRQKLTMLHNYVATTLLFNKIASNNEASILLEDLLARIQALMPSESHDMTFMLGAYHLLTTVISVHEAQKEMKLVTAENK